MTFTDFKVIELIWNLVVIYTLKAINVSNMTILSQNIKDEFVFQAVDTFETYVTLTFGSRSYWWIEIAVVSYIL